MAKNIVAQALGGTPKTGLQASTVQEAYDALELDGNYSATVNGSPADFSKSLKDYDQVNFAPNVKGA